MTVRAITTEGVPLVTDPHVADSDDQLHVLEELVAEQASVAGDVIPVGDHQWAIHGYVPFDGDELLAEFDTYDDATNVLGKLPVRDSGPAKREPETRCVNQICGVLRGSQAAGVVTRS
jgi:hypothetical protein